MLSAATRHPTRFVLEATSNQPSLADLWATAAVADGRVGEERNPAPFWGGKGINGEKLRPKSESLRWVFPWEPVAKCSVPPCLGLSPASSILYHPKIQSVKARLGGLGALQTLEPSPSPPPCPGVSSKQRKNKGMVLGNGFADD